jgi:hypothetical protein
MRLWRALPRVMPYQQAKCRQNDRRQQRGEDEAAQQRHDDGASGHNERIGKVSGLQQ